MKQRIEQILGKLDDEEKLLVEKLFKVVEESRAHIELGYGSFSLMRTIQEAYEPEIINLFNWVK